MKAVLVDLHSPDVDDLSKFRPNAEEPLQILVQAIVKPDSMDGSESFDFIVCNVAYLERELEFDKILNGRHRLLVKKYDYSILRGYVENLCEKYEGKNWLEIGAKLSRFGQWEFEDYKN